MPQSETRDVFDRFLAAVSENRWDDLADLYAEDVVIEMGFTPPGVPQRSQGREVLRSRFKDVSKIRRLVKADNVVVHETADPEVLIAELDLHNELLADGSAFVSPYVMIMTIRDGEIVHSRDYGDTAATASLVARLTELRSGSTAG